MSMNQHYSSDSAHGWTTQQEHTYQPMLMQATHRDPNTDPSNYSCPSQFYHPQQNCFNSSNPHDLQTSSSHHSCQVNTPPFNLNMEEEEVEEDTNGIAQDPSIQQDEYDPEGRGVVQEREPMFEKLLTPSDVGKLNRLVIPKQHAEKYFPLSGESDQQKGLLLSFEDEFGKCWKFRYSYWNSSQSYVLTKGWSRYVKEKRLDAGDIVLFERDANVGQRLYIGWRKRRQQKDQSAGAHVSREMAAVGHSNSWNWNNNINMNAGNGGVDMRWTRVVYSALPYPTPQPPPLPYQLECLHAGKEVSCQTTSSLGSSSKVLRLFGVNMACQSDGSEPSTPGDSSMSSHALSLHQYYHQHQTSYHSQSPHDHMQDITVHGDVDQVRNRRG